MDVIFHKRDGLWYLYHAPSGLFMYVRIYTVGFTHRYYISPLQGLPVIQVMARKRIILLPPDSVKWESNSKRSKPWRDLISYYKSFDFVLSRRDNRLVIDVYWIIPVPIGTECDQGILYPVPKGTPEDGVVFYPYVVLTGHIMEDALSPGLYQLVKDFAGPKRDNILLSC